VAPEPAREGENLSLKADSSSRPTPSALRCKNIHEAMETVRSQREVPSGTLRINAFPTAAREIMAPLTLEFLRPYPAIHPWR